MKIYILSNNKNIDDQINLYNKHYFSQIKKIYLDLT